MLRERSQDMPCTPCPTTAESHFAADAYNAIGVIARAASSEPLSGDAAVVTAALRVLARMMRDHPEARDSCRGEGGLDLIAAALRGLALTDASVAAAACACVRRACHRCGTFASLAVSPSPSARTHCTLAAWSRVSCGVSGGRLQPGDAVREPGCGRGAGCSSCTGALGPPCGARGHLRGWRALARV